MRDARYLRSQAEWCLELARQMSDRKTADNLKAEAARYQAEALVIRRESRRAKIRERQAGLGSALPTAPLAFPMRAAGALQGRGLDVHASQVPAAPVREEGGSRPRAVGGQDRGECPARRERGSGSAG